MTNLETPFQSPDGTEPSSAPIFPGTGGEKKPKSRSLRRLVVLCVVIGSLVLLYQYLLGRSPLPSSASLVAALDPPVAAVASIDAADTGQRQLILRAIDAFHASRVAQVEKEKAEGKNVSPPSDMRWLLTRAVAFALPIRMVLTIYPPAIPDSGPALSVPPNSDVEPDYLLILGLSRGASIARTLLRHVRSTIALPDVPEAEMLPPEKEGDAFVGMVRNCLVVARDERLLKKGLAAAAKAASSTAGMMPQLPLIGQKGDEAGVVMSCRTQETLTALGLSTTRAGLTPALLGPCAEEPDPEGCRQVADAAATTLTACDTLAFRGTLSPDGSLTLDVHCGLKDPSERTAVAQAIHTLGDRMHASSITVSEAAPQSSGLDATLILSHFGDVFFQQ